MKYSFTLALGLCIFCTNAQSVANYTVAHNTGITYSSIDVPGNSFTSWRNTATFSQDDNRSDYTDIGFDFWYDGNRYTQFCVSTNGFIDFATNTADGTGTGAFGYSNSAFSQSNVNNSTRPAIAPFYDDMTAQGGTAALGNSIKYLLSGTAPHRTLTIEWIDMAVYNNTTPNLNFQVMLVESSGQVLMNYGTMTGGTNNYSYSMGLNAPTISNNPQASQLKELQTNGNFSNNAQNALSTVPASNSQYIFTPPTPTPVVLPTYSLSYTGISQTGMTVHWSNWANNETGYAVYNSIDGVNYDFVSQTTANTTQLAVTGLVPSTTYFWKVYAVTEGCLSGAVTGSQVTLVAGTKTSIASGSWNTSAIWSPSGSPTAGDNVIIANGTTVSINSANSACNNLTIGQGASGALFFTGTTARSMTVNSNITVKPGASFQPTTNSNVTHTITIDGNIINNGTINFAADNNSLINVIFDRDGNQSISGTGATTYFNRITMDMGSVADNVLEISTPSFSAASSFLTLNSGTLKLSMSGASSLTTFTAATTMPANTGLYLNSANLSVSMNSSLTLYGNLTVANGTLNLGNASNESLISNGGTVHISGGACNIAGRLDGSSVNNLCDFTISGGVLTVPTFGSTNTTVAPFHISGAGSECNMTGGMIVIQREGGSGSQNLGFINTNTSDAIVTGGTLQIGNSATPNGQVIEIDSDSEIHNLVINSSNVTASVTTDDLNVKNDITITAGILNVGNRNILLGGNWNNAATFTPGTGTVTFNGTGAQSIFKSGGETFSSLVFAGSGVTTFASPVAVSGSFSIAAGAGVDVSASSYSLNLKGNFTNNGTFNAQNGIVTFNGSTAQIIGGSATTNFYNLTLNNTAGASLSGAVSLTNKLTLSGGTFNTNSQIFTMLSSAGNTARIAPITGSGNFSGNATIQRFAPGGYTGWALLGSSLSSTPTISDWDNEIYISCSTCPDGSAGGFISIYTYDETVAGAYDGDASYIPFNNVNDPILPGKGYWVYLGDGPTTTNDITYDLTGTPGKFATALPLKYTNHGTPTDDGWNLIANPYPSPISWAALRNGNTNVNNAVYVYNTDLSSGTGDFASYVNGISSPDVGSGGQGDVIAAGQGFYVHVTSATTLTAQETYKVDANPTFLRTESTTSSQALMRLKLQSNGSDVDETVLYFEPSAHDYFDAAYDAYKMRSLTPGAALISLQNNNNDFQINGVAPVNGNFSMPLKAVTGASGTFTITAENISSFPQGACIHLYDSYNNTTTDLRTSDYVCTLSDTTTQARFTLNITLNALNANVISQQPTCVQPHQGALIAHGSTGGPWNYYWTQNGTVVKTSINKAGADTLSNLSGGNYDLAMNTTGACDHYENSYVIYEQQLPVAGFSSVDTLDLDFFSTVQFVNTSSDAASSYWSFGTGQDFSNSSSPVFSYTMPGQYNVNLVVTSATGCTDTISKRITVISTALGVKSFSSSENCLLKTLDADHFVVSADFASEITCTALLTDVQGNLLKNYGTITGSQLNILVNLQDYDHGIYFLTLVSGADKKVLKLTK